MSACVLESSCAAMTRSCRASARGSLAVHVGGAQRGTWRDFEADRSGGLLALVEHLAQCDHDGALAWLVDAGLIAAPSNDTSRPPAPSVPPPGPWRGPSRRAQPPTWPAPTWPAGGLGRRSAPAPTCPRWCAGCPPRPWPTCPRGRPATATPRRLVLPADAAGAVVYVLSPPSATPLHHAEAASIDAITARNRPGSAVVLCEGPADALALALTGAVSAR